MKQKYLCVVEEIPLTRVIWSEIDNYIYQEIEWNHQRKRPKMLHKIKYNTDTYEILPNLSSNKNQKSLNTQDQEHRRNAAEILFAHMEIAHKIALQWNLCFPIKSAVRSTKSLLAPFYEYSQAISNLFLIHSRRFSMICYINPDFVDTVVKWKASLRLLIYMDNILPLCL